MIAAVAEVPAEPGVLRWSVAAAGDADYPARFAELADAPARVWWAGAPVTARTIAIVGSRAATPYGLAVARTLAADLARLGFAIASGLARGIDAAAHEGALAAGGASVALLPGGPDAITPPEHAPLAARIAARGQLITEVPPGAGLTRARFAKRNRLIAALAHATVVVEAAESSGALITARDARRLGRAVLAVPGDVDRPTSRGTLALLRGGARPCADSGDVLAALREADGAAPRVRRAGTRRVPASAVPAADATPEARVAAVLDRIARPVESVAGAANLDAPAALAALLTLEWAGVAARAAGGRWRRVGGRG